MLMSSLRDGDPGIRQAAEKVVDAITAVFEKARTCEVTEADILSPEQVETYRDNQMMVHPPTSAGATIKLIKHERAVQQFRPSTAP